MMYHLGAYRRRWDDVPRVAIFSVPNTNFVEIENQFSCTSLDAFFQILDCLMQKRLWYLQTLPFLRDTFRADDFIGVSKNK
jgi:hypothetical protein